MAKREYSWGFYKLRSILGVNICRNRSTYVSGTGHQGHEVPATKVPSYTYTIWHRGYSMNNPLGLRLFSSTSNKTWTKLEQPLPAAKTSSKHTIANWAKWILGSLLTVLISFWRDKYWGNLQKIEGEAEVVMEEVENVAEIIERVATVSEKVSAQVADKLPDHTKLKETALLVERVSEIAAQDAQLTQDIIHKVDALKQDLGDLKTLVRPVVDKIENHEFQGNYSPVSTKEQN
ncbi:hypothetical protein M0R45_008839 [Rubus argutus]|uniref:Uncharacterized protein n=1 Tax=Rubus argutus TaxID=59490 RepID=A0AAW1Y2C2_RUBAR